MATRVSARKVAPEELFLDRLPRATRKAFLYCTSLPFLDSFPWYLAGGTALALQAGHRQSVDLDFFTPKKDFKTQELERRLFVTGEWTTTFQEQGTLYGELLKAKASFITYPFFVPSPEQIRCGNITVLTMQDIAAMKVLAICQRGRKRDFVDLYWYCSNIEPLQEVILRSKKQYPGKDIDLNYILRSIVYFEDAEEDPMPKIFFKADWRGVKKYFQKEATRLTKELFEIR